MAEENKKVLKETLEEPTEEETSSDNKDIIEIEWEEIEKVYALRNELQELEQYFERLNADLGPEMERMLEGMESGEKRGFWASFKSLFEGD